MTEKQLRELSVDELDVEAALHEFMLVSGAAWSALEASISEPGQTGSKRIDRRRIADTYFRSIALQKALAELAREQPARLRQLWAAALREPMPFGMPPVGMPKVEVEP